MGDGSSIKEVVIATRSSNVTLANDGTVNDDNELLIAIKASEIIIITAELHWTAAAAAGGFRAGLNGPAIGAGTLTWRNYVFNNAATTLDAGLFSAYGGSSGIQDDSGVSRIEGVLYNGATAGNIIIAWSQHTSNANNTTLRKGSWLQVKRI